MADALRINETLISKWAVTIPDKHLRRVLEVYTNLSADWLIRGKGSMFVSTNIENPLTAQEPTLPYNTRCTNPLCVKEISSLHEQVEELRADKRFLQETVEDLRRKVGPPPENKDTGSVAQPAVRAG